MFCTECGTKAADTAKFCANCGTKLLNKETLTENNTQVISATNTDDGETSDPIEIGSFFKSDPNYFGDLSNDVVTKAAENGNIYAQMDMIRRCGRDHDQIGARIWEIVVLPERINIAKQGDFKERISLASNYKFGTQGTEKNENESDYWFKTAFNDCMKAAEQGDAIAQCNLGECFKNGYGINIDKEKAIYWLKKAAEQGNSDAMSILQNIYGNMLSRIYDKHKADYWDKIYDTRCAEKKKEEFHKIKEAAKQGDACKQYELARRCLCNEGVEENIEAAELWFGLAFSGFKKAAEQGDARAQTRLGECYWYGRGVQEDKQTALMWYKKAAEQGNNEAMWRISDWYSFVENDYERRQWLNKAAKQGSTDASRELGYLNAPKVSLESLQESLKSMDFDAELNKAFAGFVESPMDKLGKIAKNALNDVDIVEVMSNPKVAIAKYGFNIVKEIFAENTKKEGLL